MYRRGRTFGGDEITHGGHLALVLVLGSHDDGRLEHIHSKAVVARDSTTCICSCGLSVYTVRISSARIRYASTASDRELYSTHCALHLRITE